MPASLYQSNFNLERISSNEMDHSNSAVKLAMELANLCAFNGLQDIDQHASLSDHFNLGNGQTLAQINDELKAKKSQNMTECVPVPSSEHVAEIVGRQGELSFIDSWGRWGISKRESCLIPGTVDGGNRQQTNRLHRPSNSRTPTGEIVKSIVLITF